MSEEVPQLLSITANRTAPDQIHLQISTFENGSVVDAKLNLQLSMMLVKLMVNAIAGVGELPDDQKC